MKRTISLFMVIAFAALMSVSSNALATSEPEKMTDEAVEQGQQMAEEEEAEVTEESVIKAEEMHQEGEQAVETMQDEAKEMAPQVEE